jgi:hypothetical protein
MCQDSAGEGGNVERILDVQALGLFLPRGNLLKGYHTAWDFMVTDAECLLSYLQDIRPWQAGYLSTSKRPLSTPRLTCATQGHQC